MFRFFENSALFKKFPDKLLRLPACLLARMKESRIRPLFSARTFAARSIWYRACIIFSGTSAFVYPHSTVCRKRLRTCAHQQASAMMLVGTRLRHISTTKWGKQLVISQNLRYYLFLLTYMHQTIQ